MKQLAQIVLFIIGLYIIYMLSSSIRQLWRKGDELTRAQAKLQEAKEMNQQLKAQLSYVKSDTFVEKEAREKLHLVKPDETLVFLKENQSTISATPTLIPPNWKQWIDLFY